MEADLFLEMREKSPKENMKATAIELFRRATLLHESSQILQLDYTYELIKVTDDKREARKQLGNMAAEILELMRDELVIAGIRTYASQLTKPELDAILEGTKDAS